MMKEAVLKKIVSEETGNSLQHMFSNLLIFDINSIVCANLPQPLEPQETGSIIKNLGSVEGVISTLSFLKLPEKRHRRNNGNASQSSTNISSLTFCRPVKYNLKDEKMFWIMKDKKKKNLKLDNPKAVLILPNDYYIAIERKYINLYELDQNLDSILKDFDSSGIGKKMTLCEVKYLNYKGKDTVIIFGNQKEGPKLIFQALVFIIDNGKLKFIKKNQIAEKQIMSPTIIFQNYPNEREHQKFCLVIGGSCDNSEVFHYSALKIDLHIFLNNFLTYDISNTETIAFTSKIPILSGKALSYKQMWYCFCSEEQTINGITLQFGGLGKALTKIDIKSQKLNWKEKIFFSEDSLHYIYEGDKDKIVFMDKNINLRERALDEIIWKFYD